MSDPHPREEFHDAPEGLPWQVVYAAFLGVLLSALAFYGGLYLRGAGDVAGGIALIVLSAGLAACFVALLAGASWALSVCRIATMAAMAVMLACLAWRVVEATRKPEWKLPGARAWRLTLDALYEPQALMLLAGLGACAFVLCLLLGPTLKRFVGRT